MTDRLSLYNGALRKVQERSLSSLSENREPRRLLDGVWDNNAVKACLEAGQWTFATRKVALPYSDSIEPIYGFDYAYEPDSDFLRLVGISSSQDMRAPLTEYEFLGGLFFANYEQIYLTYVSIDAAYGLDYSLWPQSFVDYVEWYLANGIAPRLCSSQTHVSEVKKSMRDALSNALSIDSQRQPSKVPASGTWARSRRGYSSRGYYRGEG